MAGIDGYTSSMLSCPLTSEFGGSIWETTLAAEQHDAGGVSQRTPNLQLRNGQLAAVVVCAPACRQASTKVIRAATGFIGAHGDGGRQFGQIRAGFGEGLI